MKISRTIVALLAVDVVLAALVAYLAPKPRPMVVVPGARERAAPADTPDEHSIVSFGLLLAMNFDNYTHATLDEQDRLVLAKVSPRFATELERVTARLGRGSYVLFVGLESPARVPKLNVEWGIASRELIELFGVRCVPTIVVPVGKGRFRISSVPRG